MSEWESDQHNRASDDVLNRRSGQTNPSCQEPEARRTKATQHNRRTINRAVYNFACWCENMTNMHRKQHRNNRKLSRYRSESDRYQLVLPIC